MKVIVTGGSGFVGRRLQLIRPDWIYLSSKDLDLLDADKVFSYFSKEKPDAVVHLAAKVGGIKDNAEHPADFFYQNAKMNINVVDGCRATGVPRLLASLSTCAFPNVVAEYPYDESALLDGAPAETNLAYGFTKRLMWVHINSLRKQFGLDYSCFSPSNLYGPEDNFDLEKSHFVAAAIRKIHESEGDVEFWGTGKPLRQQLYVDDLCKAIPVLLDRHHTSDPIIVAPNENLSIKEMVDTISTIINKDLSIKYNGALDGQYRKDGSNALFLELCPDFEFTAFEEGVRKTYDWYNETSSNNRN
jgi:GDP-L-fucose synthase